MPRGSKPGEKRGPGRKGIPNKSTIEKHLKIAQELARQAGQPHKRLAKEVLEDFMHLTAGMAALYQPTAPGQPINAYANEEKFWQAANACREFAKALAPYQSPTFRAITVSAPPDERSKAPVLDLQANGDGKVIDLSDPVALQRVYMLRIGRVQG